MVKFVKNGEPLKMSKRSGNFITAREVIDEVGADALRFIMLTRKNDAPFDFDLAKVIEQSKDNPIFYVQYAHARICSILRSWGGDESQLLGAKVNLLESRAAHALMQRLGEFPQVLADAAKDLGPHAIAFYLRDLASDFHSFYNSDRVLVEDAELRLARITLLVACKQVIKNGLNLLGVSSPEQM
jgi:arginyl-tRNA synthetase